MLKTNNKSYRSNFFIFSIIPAINLLVFLIFWTRLPFNFNLINFQIRRLYFIILLGLIGFGLLLSGWISNSKYALFGSLRSIVQSISYEICLALTILIVLNLKDTFSFTSLKLGFINFEYMFSLILIIPVITIILAECGRTPFDLLEAERELVRGFNVEFRSVEFAFLFIGEYGIIIILRIIFRLIIFPVQPGLISLLIITSILFIRYTLPRIRYDYLIQLIWKSILPSIILIWILSFNIKIL